MATNDEKQAFAKRLTLALKRSRKKIATPSELAVQFGLHYGGEPISTQAVQKWMSGRNQPSPDKIETLATMLNVSYQWLRFGIPETAPASKRPTSSKPSAKPVVPTLSEALLLSRLRSLPEDQQDLVTEIVAQFALQQEMWL